VFIFEIGLGSQKVPAPIRHFIGNCCSQSQPINKLKQPKPLIDFRGTDTPLVALLMKHCLTFVVKQ
jgi:hypothetical protein